jgi:membrane fusion protein (multidrug efflux system)
MNTKRDPVPRGGIGEEFDMELKSREADRKKKRLRLRILSLILGVVIVVAGGLLVMNLSAAKADGADATQAESVEEAETKEKSRNSDGEEGEEKAPVPVEVTEVARGTVASYITSTANLVAENQVKILSEFEGRVSRLAVEEGDFVSRNQVLATLVRDDAEIALRKAELKETNASLAYDRGQDLIEKELISREEFDRFTMDYEIAKQELAEAKWRLEKTTIRAPFGGQISERMIQVGQNIQLADELFQITDYDPLIARIFLPERDILGLEEGRDVKIRLNAAENVEFSGRIRQISPIVDTSTGTVKVTVEAVDEPRAVRPGSFVTINIVRETHSEALLIPREAVVRELQSAHVFVVEEEFARRRDIALGLEEGDVVEALNGLEQGERVITAGQGGLRDGAPVKILGAESENGEPAQGEETEESLS